MNRSVGGEILIDLLPIELEESVDGETFTNITEQSIIEQLTNLKQYINNQKMIKPVWVKLLNGEDDKIVVVKGQLSKVVDQPEFDIEVSIKGYTLTIHVEFTQVTLSDDTPIDDWYIDTGDAKYLFTTEAQNIGAISELPIFENIVDKNGNSRFIEGDITLLESVSSIIQTYGKWSLSGSHLIFVVSGRIPANTTIGTLVLARIELPTWIMNKIIPSGQNEYQVAVKYAEQWEDRNAFVQPIMYCGLQKLTNNNVQLATWGEKVFTNETFIRLQFDLLIDTD